MPNQIACGVDLKRRYKARYPSLERINEISAWTQRPPYWAHFHITTRKEMPNGGYVLSNGITLCPDHHKSAEVWHSSGHTDFVQRMHPDDLYKRIGSSKNEAEIDSVMLDKTQQYP